MKFSRLVITVAVLSLALAAPASAGVDLPIKGTVIGGGGPDVEAPGCPGTPIWRFNSPGTGNMSHLGKVDSFLTHCTYPDLTFGYGTIRFTAANGDELVIAQEGSCLPILDESENFLGYTCEATWTAVGGSGRFAHATDPVRSISSATSPVVTRCSASMARCESTSRARSRTTRRIVPSGSRLARDIRRAHGRSTLLKLDGFASWALTL